MIKTICLFVLLSILTSLDAAHAFTWPRVAIDASISQASKPFADESLGASKSTEGLGIGVNLDMHKTPRLIKFIARAELGYYKWNYSAGYTSGSLTRMPLFLGVRIYMPYKLFIDAGLEHTFDTVESRYTGPLYGTYSPGVSHKNYYHDLGLAPGIGVEFPITGNATMGAQARYHGRIGFGIDSYYILGVFVGRQF